MEVSAIWIRRIGDNVILAFEADGLWYKAASEYVDGSFSHIVELNHTGKGPDAGKPRPLADFPLDKV